MVGTNPTLRPESRAARDVCFIQSIVRMISIIIFSRGLLSWLTGTFAEKINHVGSLRDAAKLAKKSRDLSAMVCAVIHQMLHSFPERVPEQRTLRVAEFNYARYVVRRKRADVTTHFGVDSFPASFDVGKT